MSKALSVDLRERVVGAIAAGASCRAAAVRFGVSAASAIRWAALARALYRQPRILFMDEGTAHLDVDNERQINERLRRLSITRISIAHRPGMAQGADVVVRI